jgi:hypothetical protein
MPRAAGAQIMTLRAMRVEDDQGKAKSTETKYLYDAHATVGLQQHF